jgi:cell division septation protein DedD
LEQQAKERLTGGVILVVLLVLLVPELLTGPHAVPAPTAAQPDQAPMRSYTLDLRESPQPNRAPVAASTAAPAAPEPTPAVSSEPTSAPSPIAPPATTRLPAEHPAALPPRARAPTPTPAPAHSTEHATALWSVQLGTFSSRENAAHLVAGLKSHGFTGSISEASRNGHKLFRVRVGAERDRVAAQKLLGRLKAAGEKGGEIVPH